MLLQQLTCGKALKRAQADSRDEALCTLGELAEQGFGEKFQELILRVLFFYLLISRKALKSFMVMTVPCD